MTNEYYKHRPERDVLEDYRLDWEEVGFVRGLFLKRTRLEWTADLFAALGRGLLAAGRSALGSSTRLVRKFNRRITTWKNK
jgi:hypothetical protein